MAFGVSCGVFKARLLLRIETNFYIGTGGVFKGLVLGVARFAGLDLEARMCCHSFLPIRLPGLVCLFRGYEPDVGIRRHLGHSPKAILPRSRWIVRTRDMLRRGQHEAHWPLINLGRRISGFPDDINRQRDLRDVNGRAVEYV